MSTSYKILVSILTERLYMHLGEPNIGSTDQKYCFRDIYVCKNQLFINRMIFENTH